MPTVAPGRSSSKDERGKLKYYLPCDSAFDETDAYLSYYYGLENVTMITNWAQRYFKWNDLCKLLRQGQNTNIRM